MSSELFMLENSLISDFFSPFTDSTTIHHNHHHHHDNIFQRIPNNMSSDETNSFQETPLDENIFFDQIGPVLLSTSPPSHQLENLSLCQAPHFADNNGSSCVTALEVKTEEECYGNSFLPQGCVCLVRDDKLMQRSCSSSSFDNKPSLLFQPCFDGLMESPNLHNHQVVSSPESSFSSSQMRRVCSTGDLHKMKNTPTRNILSSSPLSTERSFITEEAANTKVSRYSPEERKERIDRYRAKRTQRNFNKTIKYACRKTLADNRPRIRGRFARNDEAGEIPKTATFNTSYRYEDDDLWVDGLHEEDQYYRY